MVTSINDLYLKQKNEKSISPKEYAAIKNFERYEYEKMRLVASKNISDFEFFNAKTLILAKRNLENYNYFLNEYL